MSALKQPEAMRLADLLESRRVLTTDTGSPLNDAAVELRRLHAECESEMETIKTLGRLVNQQGVDFVALSSQRDLLLAALRQLRMWLPITAEMADLDPEGTAVEFSVDGRPLETISIASSMQAADRAIAQATGEKP